MPPAFVLSQDQTLKFDVRQSGRWNNPPEGRHFKEPFLHKSITYGYVKDMYWPPPKRTSMENHWNGILLPSTRRLEAVGPGAAAHMSLHLNQQCQRAKNTDAGSFLPLPGSPGRLGFFATAVANQVAQRRGEEAYMETPNRRQRLIAILFQTPPQPAEMLAFPIWVGGSRRQGGRRESAAGAGNRMGFSDSSDSPPRDSRIRRPGYIRASPSPPPRSGRSGI